MTTTIRLAFPNVAYSYLEITLDNDEDFPDLSNLIAWMETTDSAYLDTFAPNQNGRNPEAHEIDDDEPPHPADARSESQPARRPQQGRNGGKPGGAQFGVRVTCMEHNADCRPSMKNKTIEFDEGVGKDIPASWFHSLGEGQGTCSVWRSRAQITALD